MKYIIWARFLRTNHLSRTKFANLSKIDYSPCTIRLYHSLSKKYFWFLNALTKTLSIERTSSEPIITNTMAIPLILPPSSHTLARRSRSKGCLRVAREGRHNHLNKSNVLALCAQETLYSSGQLITFEDLQQLNNPLLSLSSNSLLESTHRFVVAQSSPKMMSCSRHILLTRTNYSHIITIKVRRQKISKLVECQKHITTYTQLQTSTLSVPQAMTFLRCKMTTLTAMIWAKKSSYWSLRGRDKNRRPHKWCLRQLSL